VLIAKAGDIMNCLETRKIIPIHIASGGVSLANNELFDHIASCELCLAHYEESLLLTGLTNLDKPIMSAGFADKAIKQAIENHQQAKQERAASPPSLYRRVVALVLIVSFMGLILVNQNPVAHNEKMAQLNTANGTASKQINVVIDSLADRENTTVTIELAENLELQGYPNRKTLSWTTNIRKGKNLLTLPVLFKDHSDSYLTLSYAYGPANKRIHIDVSHDKADHSKQPTT
tara:strand:+ start:4566 stop:5261 length:696 start_codon:yes stop_codon:yes gene_type:complete